MSEQPAATVNCGYDAEGLPIGLQIVGGGSTSRRAANARAYEATQGRGGEAMAEPPGM